MRALLRIFFWATVVFGLLCLVLYFAAFEPWTVPSDDPTLGVSLAPALAPGDLVLVSRSTTGEVGPLVRCPDPDAPGRFVVARVVAKSGAVVDITAGKVRVDNHSPPTPSRCATPKVTVRNPTTQVDEELACSDEELGGSSHPVLETTLAEKDTHVTVEGGQLFVISDNRAMHFDSRDFGLVSSNVCQRIVFRLWGTASDDPKRFSLVW